MREGNSSHFVCLCVTFDFGEGAVFRVETYISTRFKSFKCSTFLKIKAFGEKASGTLAVTAVIYAGTSQSLNGLARELLVCELLARGTLHQSCHSFRSQLLDRFIFCQAYLHMHLVLFVAE